MTADRARIVSPVHLPDGSLAPDGAKIIFTLTGWDKNATSIILGGASEAVVESGAIDTYVHRVGAGDRQSAILVASSYFNSASRRWVTEHLGQIAPDGPGPFDLADLLAVPVTTPTPPDVLAQAIGAAAAAAADADRAEAMVVDAAAVAADRAATEAARDAAQADANVYASTAAGLAAVPGGGQFMVVVGDDIVRYEDVGGVATEVARYPTAGALAEVREVFGGYQPLGYNPASSLTPGIALDVVNSTTGRRVAAILDTGEVVSPGGPLMSADLKTARLTDDGTVLEATALNGDLIIGPNRYGVAFELLHSTADGAVLHAVDRYGVDIAARDLDAWVSGGQVWLYVHGKTAQITAHVGAPWVYAAIRGGQLVMVQTDGTRYSTPISGSYPHQGHSRSVNMVMTYGQSNAAGNASGAVINGSPFSDHYLMFAAGQRAFGNALGHSQERTQPQIAVYDAIHDFVPGCEQLIAGAGETANSGLAWGLLAGEMGPDQTLLTACPAVGSANIPMLRRAATEYSDSPDNLNPRGQPWKNLEEQFIRARLFWALQGYDFTAFGMIWNQGEGHIAASEASYRALLDTIQADWQGLAAEWMATPSASDQGYVGIAPLITAQTSNGNQYAYSTSQVPMAQLRICTDDPTTALCLGPMYDQDHAADGVHMTSAGQEMQGARAACALNAWLRGEEWMPLHVTSAVRSGTTVTLTIYNHDNLPLIFDDTTITGLGADQGFRWVDDGSTATVIGASVISPTTVTLLLSEAPTGANPYVQVAMTGTSGASAGPATGNRATLRTNAASPPTTRGGRPVHHFVCIDRIAVTI